MNHVQFFLENKISFTGTNAGDYLDFEDFDKYVSQLKAENEKLKAYIEYVDGKVEIDEFPLSLDQWEEII